MITTLILIIITIFIPPLGVFLTCGCGADLLINLLLTFLGYFPGHIHAFYIEYVYYSRRDQARAGVDPMVNGRAPGVYSGRVQRGGWKGGRDGGGQVGGYAAVGGEGYVPAQQGYVAPVGQPVGQPVGGYGGVQGGQGKGQYGTM